MFITKWCYIFLLINIPVLTNILKIVTCKDAALKFEVISNINLYL